MINSRYLIYKRVLDTFVVAGAVALLSPIFLVLALLVWIKQGSPGLYYQQRPGLDGESFTLLKFRTMTECRDEHANCLPDANRLTALGRFLRSTSLDDPQITPYHLPELPQLNTPSAECCALLNGAGPGGMAGRFHRASGAGAD